MPVGEAEPDPSSASGVAAGVVASLAELVGDGGAAGDALSVAEGDASMDSEPLTDGVIHKLTGSATIRTA